MAGHMTRIGEWERGETSEQIISGDLHQGCRGTSISSAILPHGFISRGYILICDNSVTNVFPEDTRPLEAVNGLR
jgi:hypothetical protein